jgi:hypothetical protein
MNRHFVRAGVVGFLAVALPCALVVRLLAADDKKAEAEPSQLAKDLIGTWVMVGTPDKIGEAPETGGRFKFRTGKYWNITEADPKTGEVVFHHGGTYTLDGDEYVETVKYALPNTKDIINQQFKFKVKVEGDTYTQIGIGNEFNEVWKRAK